MNELALFAGAGGGILAGHLLGWRKVCAVEQNEYAASVLVARQNDRILPPFPIWSDICTFDGKPWRGLVDVVSGGFPCQAFSTAARGNNTARDYWPEMLRIVGEIQPRKFVFAENVSEDAICNAQADLAEAGYKTIRMRLDAKDMGADHIRERWWLLAHPNDKGKLVCEINAEAFMLQTNGCSFWKAKPEFARVDDGMARRLDRFTAIGNGQVPQVAAAAFTMMVKQI